MGEEMARPAQRFTHYRLPGTAAAAAAMAITATRPAAICRLSRCSVVRARASGWSPSRCRKKSNVLRASAAHLAARRVFVLQMDHC